MNRRRMKPLLALVSAPLFLLGGCQEGDDAFPAISALCVEGSRGCSGAWTTLCVGGNEQPVADCAEDGWACKEGRCAAPGAETPAEEAYRTRLDDLRTENARTPLKRDRFGGWSDAPGPLAGARPGPTFRVAKLAGAWWFITPEGHPFLSKGVTDVNWLGATLSPGPYHDVLVDKYGTEDAWADASRSRLHRWGYNTVGPWSSHSMSLRMPHGIIILDSAGHAPRYPNTIVTDYWSAGFAEHARTVAKARAAPYVEDEHLIGYFLDNELVWGPDHFATDKTLLQLYVEFPAGAPGRTEALRFVRGSAGTLEAFNAAWRTNLSDWAQLNDLPGRTFRPRTRAAEAVAEAFSVEAFHRYAALAVQGLRSVDPDHLILGCRFHSYPGDTLVRAAAEYFDVISMAFYWHAPPVSEIDAVWEEVDRPFLIEEWSFKARDSGLLNIQNYAPVVPTQQDRALAYADYVEALMVRPFAVGYHWYKWFDNPWRGLEDIFSGDNFGLMTPRDEPYEPFVRFAREANLRVEAWHAASVSAAREGARR